MKLGGLNIQYIVYVPQISWLQQEYSLNDSLQIGPAQCVGGLGSNFGFSNHWLGDLEWVT